MKQVGRLLVSALIAIPLFACSSSENTSDGMILEDGAVLISGDLTYEKAMEALAPLMTKNDLSTVKVVKNGMESHEIAVDNNLSNIYIGHVVKMYFTQSDKASARLEIPTDWADKYEWKYTDGKLKVGIKPEARIDNTKNKEAHLYVSGPRLEEIEMSGASSAQIGNISQNEGLRTVISGVSKLLGGQLQLQGDVLLNCSGSSVIAFQELKTPNNFEVNVSGNSNVVTDVLKAEQYEMNCSGVSKLTFTKFEKGTRMSANLSGVSKVTVAGDIDDANVKISGTSKFKYKGNIINLDLIGSGASDVTLSGTADQARFSLSGSSKIDASGMKCNQVTKGACSSVSKIIM